ncbi:hypothetical protein L8T82_00745 [Campylobacter sp. IFREMER_LSEM_CL292]|uniref:hypothetical protein n=1 Tax=Campylobacter sp. IFREMER_LSEM_CL292 TaxID=2911623 RepID=UPI0021E72F21|nr:hypothetical protein [Campylobacter sp. IFREMER_LSEM_CL292]MCV3382383.1 hypothetical protein [Campylobacter sp. IFREMER_LSEM_CL292]
MAIVTKDFLEEFYENSVKGQYNCKWCLIPRLIRNEGESSFDPVPILNSSFVISELSNIKQKNPYFSKKNSQCGTSKSFCFTKP